MVRLHFPTMPAHHYSAPGGVARVIPPAVNDDAARAELLDLLATFGPLMLDVSRSIDRDPRSAAEPLERARDRITRALALLR